MKVLESPKRKQQKEAEYLRNKRILKIRRRRKLRAEQLAKGKIPSYADGKDDDDDLMQFSPEFLEGHPGMPSLLEKEATYTLFIDDISERYNNVVGEELALIFPLIPDNTAAEVFAQQNSYAKDIVTGLRKLGIPLSVIGRKLKDAYPNVAAAIPFAKSYYDQLDEFKHGKDSGIHIKKSKRGTFTRAAKQHGMGVQEFARKVLNAPKGKYSSAMRKKANFARNASKFKH